MSQEQATKHPFSREKGLSNWGQRVNLLHGHRHFNNAQELLNAAYEYFDHASEDYIEKQEASVYKGDVTYYNVKKMRPFTFLALCNFMGIASVTYETYRRHPELKAATEIIDDIVRRNKFEGAASGLLNANIIGRDLGLAEKHEHSGPGGGPMQITPDMSPKEAADAYAADLAGDE